MMQARRQTVFAAPRYDDAWAAIAFLELCFGFERQTVHEDPNGQVAHGLARGSLLSWARATPKVALWSYRSTQRPAIRYSRKRLDGPDDTLSHLGRVAAMRPSCAH